MNPWLLAPILGVAALIAALAWMGLLTVRSMGLRKRAAAFAGHPTVKALNGLQTAIAPLLAAQERIERSKTNVAEIAADIASVTATYLRARALLRQLSATLNDLFASVAR